MGIYGSKGTITFSIFKNYSLVLSNEQGRAELFIDHPENIQLYHVQQMREDLSGNSKHPSTG